MIDTLTEQIILGAWLSGEHTEDAILFHPMDFVDNYEIARNYLRGVTDPIDLARASNVMPKTIAEIRAQYDESFYGLAMDKMTEKLVWRWIGEHSDAGPDEIVSMIQSINRKPDALPIPETNLAEKLMDEFDSRRMKPFVKTNIAGLDRMLNGIRRKELTAVGARPSVGKSAFVQQVAIEVARQGQKVLFFPLEMSALSVAERMFMQHTEYSQYSVRTGLSDEQWGDQQTSEAFNQINNILAGGNLLIFERCNNLQTIEKLVKKHRPYMIVIDQLEQLMDGDKYWQDKRSRFSHMTHELQGMAMDQDIAVWLACQVNRSADNSRPTLANLKESGSIEEDSDNVILLHRENEEKTPVQTIVLDLAKQRNGECGTVPLVFMAYKYSFYGAERSS